MFLENRLEKSVNECKNFDPLKICLEICPHTSVQGQQTTVSL